MARPHGCYSDGVPRVPTDEPTGKPISVQLNKQPMTGAGLAVVVAAMVTTTAAETTATTVAVVTAETTAATARQQQRWQWGQQRQWQ